MELFNDLTLRQLTFVWVLDASKCAYKKMRVMWSGNYGELTVDGFPQNLLVILCRITNIILS